MSITYLVDDYTYSFSYQQLKDKYETYCMMPDEEFLKNLPAIAHLACMISYIKELPLEDTLSDVGIIHELIHLIDIPDEPTVHLNNIRESFEKKLKLV